MKILIYLAIICSTLPLARANGVENFFSKHPEQKPKYSYLVPTNIDLEIDRERQKQAELFTLLNALQSKLPKTAEFKATFAKQAQYLRTVHEDVLKAWDAFRSEVGATSELCVYRIVDGDRTENGYLVLRDGEVIKLMKESEGVNLLKS